MRPLLAVTGQRWKLWLLGVASTASALVCWFGVRQGSPVLTLIAAGAGLGGLGACALSIQCPRCSCKLLWRALRTSPASTWLVDLWAMTSCPSCAWPAFGDGDGERPVDAAGAASQRP
jgi:hypothetical protein